MIALLLAVNASLLFTSVRGPYTLTEGEATHPRMANVDLECLLPYATLPYPGRDLILRVNCITWTCLQLLACVGPLHHVGPSYDTPRWGHGAAAAKPPNRTPPNTGRTKEPLTRPLSRSQTARETLSFEDWTAKRRKVHHFGRGPAGKLPPNGIRWRKFFLNSINLINKKGKLLRLNKLIRNCGSEAES